MENYLKDKVLMRILYSYALISLDYVYLEDAVEGLDINMRNLDNTVNRAAYFMSNAERMSEYFIELGQATSSCSFYSICVIVKTKPLENQPIILFGDEG